MISLCYTKYVIALFVAIATLLIYYSPDFETFKTNFLVLIGLEMLVLLYIDFAVESEIDTLKTIIIQSKSPTISESERDSNNKINNM